MKPKIASERGQALVLIALAMIGLIGITGLAVDGSAILTDRRHAQNAADTAAMAAALEKVDMQRSGIVPAEGTFYWIDFSATERAGSNGYDDNQVTNRVDVYICDDPDSSCPAPYSGDSNYLQVIITSHVDTFFARILGIKKMTNRVNAVAVGGNMGGSGLSYDPASFRAVWTGAGPGACSNNEDYFRWSGNNYSVVGGIHSNAYIYIPSTNQEITGGTSTVVLTPTQTIGGTVQFDPPLETSTGAPKSNPFETEYTFSRFNTSGDIYAQAGSRIVLTSSKIDVAFLKSASCTIAGQPCYNETTKVLQDGIYVTTDTSQESVKINVNASDLLADGGPSDFINVTFASMGGIILDGNDHKFKPYIGNPDAAGSNSFLQNLHGILLATWWDRGGVQPDQCSKYVISTAGNNHQYQGFFYAPNGQVYLNGQPDNILGCVIAYTVWLSGNSSTITCDDTWFPDTNWSIGIVQ